MTQDHNELLKTQITNTVKTKLLKTAKIIKAVKIVIASLMAALGAILIFYPAWGSTYLYVSFYGSSDGRTYGDLYNYYITEFACIAGILLVLVSALLIVCFATQRIKVDKELLDELVEAEYIKITAMQAYAQNNPMMQNPYLMNQNGQFGGYNDPELFKTNNFNDSVNDNNFNM